MFTNYKSIITYYFSSKEQQNTFDNLVNDLFGSYGHSNSKQKINDALLISECIDD